MLESFKFNKAGDDLILSGSPNAVLTIRLGRAKRLELSERED